MLPPRYPKSPRGYQSNQYLSPYPQNLQRLSNSREKYRQLNDLNSLESGSRVSRYQHLRTPQQKRKALGKRRYINQLAYLDYEEKYIEIHTKYTMASKVTAMKKIKAKNQIAEFIEQEAQEELGFEQLMDYKYGRQSNNENFYFQKSQLIKEYQFCPKCDTIHNDHHQVHQKVCGQKIIQIESFGTRSQQYVYLSLQRILQALKRTAGQEYETLKEIVRNFMNIEQKSSNPVGRLQIQSNQLEKQLQYIYELYKVNISDNIIKEICQKIIRQLYKRNLKSI